MSGVAQTILAQLGGSRFAVMTGASSFASGPNGLTFRIPDANKLRARAVAITLTGRDDYDVEFVRVKGFEVETVAKHEGIYCDKLREVFEEATGLLTSLSPRS